MALTSVLAVILTLALLAAPLAAEAQPAGRAYRIGVFHVGDHIPPGLQTLRDSLEALGYEEGKNIQIDFQNLADEDAATRTARDFVQARVDLIVAFGNPTARAARAATSEIPIVMVHVTDPVAQGFVKTLARPGGNSTGFVFFAISPAKQIELFKEMLPRLRRVLLLVDPRDPVTAGQLDEIRAAARTLKLTLEEREATDQADLERIFASIKRGEVDGVVSASINLQTKFTAPLIRLASEKRLPSATYRREAVRAGALFSYAPDIAAIEQRAATYVDRILKGARPTDLPVEQPTKFELVINLKTAKALGLTIPPSVLARADEIIQ
jgi:putative ABC transport system substrate-binding protein